MGEFLLKFAEDASVQRIPNTLVHGGAAKILRRVFTGGSAMSFAIGLAGPNLSSRENRPNTGCNGGALDQSLTYAGVTLACQEGGGLNDMMRRCMGYMTPNFPDGHRPLSFNVFNEAYGGIFESNWITFINQQLWEPHGDWDNPNTPTTVEKLGNDYYGGWYSYWEHVESESKILGYPWHLPYIKCSGFYFSPEDELEDWPGYFDQWEDDPADDPQLRWLCDFRKLGGLPLTIAFVVDRSSATLIAYARFARPLLWRPGSKIFIKYRGRIG